MVNNAVLTTYLTLFLSNQYTGRASKGMELYISRTTGNDSWSCNQTNPCETIWRAVTLASRKDKIHLNGTDTENHPYTCQSGTRLHTGVYINKSLSLVGFGPKPPHIRCSEGLTFNGTDDAHQMHITLSGLFLDESLVYFQDSSLNIDRCKFEGSKRGVQFSVSTRIVSTIQITDSTFVNNSECVSVVVNKATNLLEAVQVIFKLKDSSFHGNAMPDKGNCVSFSESSGKKHSVSVNITLENLTFSDNKFSSKGLVFLDMENGNQVINLQKVKFIKNSVLSGRNFFANASELIFHSNTVNIFINESNLSSTNARSFIVTASNIAMQIFNSRFGGNKCKGNGGVIFLKGTDLCKVNVSNSSFVNTSASQGGAFDIECVEVRFNLLESIFLLNNATNGNGGAVLISGYRASVWFLNSSFTNSVAEGEAENSGGALFVTSELPSIHRSTFQARHVGNAVFLTVERCSFNGCRSYFGGALCVMHSNHLKLVIKHSDFIFNYAYGSGKIYEGAALMQIFRTRPKALRNDCLTRNTGIFETSIENSTFSRNDGCSLYLLGNQHHSVITFNKVIMESNIAGNVQAFIWSASKLTISHSRFLNNRAVAEVGGIFIRDVANTEVADSIFDGNYVMNGTYSIDDDEVGGAALFLQNYEIDLRYYNNGAFVSIINSTFNNCSASRGGAIFLVSDKRLHLTINSSRFTKNRSVKGGGATWVSLAEDTKIPEKCDADYRPSWHYQSHVIFENTTFEENIADDVGGAVYITNGNVTLSRCHFVDNFASLGSHVYTADGSTSLYIRNSRFNEIVKESIHSTPNSTNPSFIDFESGGPIVLYNTTLNASLYRNKITLIVLTKSSLSFLRKSNLTNFSCPLGSKMTYTNFTTKIRSQRNRSCEVRLITQYIRYDCLACADNTYSLLRGHAIEGQIDPGFQCFQCPFGAKCTRNIAAKPNFWGFKEQKNPSTLRFTMCPAGYCTPLQEPNFPEYNGCHGNRFGELCGQCNEGYTETLYSTKCQPSQQCRDYWFWPVALFYVSLMAFYFIFTPPIVPWIRRQIVWFKENIPDNQQNNFDKGYLKILFYFYQVANLLVVASSPQLVIKSYLIEPIVGFCSAVAIHSDRICLHICDTLRVCSALGFL